MKKVWLPSNAYATLKEIAKRQGVTPDEALVEIILENTGGDVHGESKI